MAKYFNLFPKTAYFVDDHIGLNLVTNIISRFKFIDSVKEIASSYFLYDNIAGETPESLAYKFYGSVERHWIILLYNDIIDPQFDWYKNYETFNRYVAKKYESLGGIPYAQSTIKKYIIREERSINFFEGTKTIIEDRETDLSTYADFAPSTTTLTLTNSENYTLTITTSKLSQTIFDYENEENEKRRSIKIIKKQYVSRIEEELKNLASL